MTVPDSAGTTFLSDWDEDIPSPVGVRFARGGDNRSVRAAAAVASNCGNSNLLWQFVEQVDILEAKLHTTDQEKRKLQQQVETLQERQERVRPCRARFRPWASANVVQHAAELDERERRHQAMKTELEESHALIEQLTAALKRL